MRRIIISVFVFILSIMLCSCGKTSVNDNELVQLKYYYDDVSVDVQLSEQESESITEILDGKDLFFDNPSCGFNEDISLKIDGKIYCLACDTCCTMKSCNSGQYFNISQSERDIIEKIFRTYGGRFPCV